MDDDALIAQVRDAVRLQIAAAGEVPPTSASCPQPASEIAKRFVRTPASAQGLAEAQGEIALKSDYLLSELTGFQDEAFVRNAYRGVLHREPDSSGLAACVEALRTARLSKPEILGHLRYSPEGRVSGVRVRGLAIAFALRRAARVPLLGRLIAMTEYVIELPRLVDRAQQLEAAVFRHRSEVAAAVQALARQEDHEQLEAAVFRHRSEVAAAVQALARQEDHEQLEAAVFRHRSEVAAAVQALARQEDHEQLEAVVLRHHSEAAAAVEGLARQVDYTQANVESAKRAAEASLAQLVDRAQHLEAAVFPSVGDAVYAAFESAFRGSREEIKQRLATYLPTVVDAYAVTAAPVVDVGCGRGEWLELLKEQNVVARGIDVNASMIAECGALKLDVVLDDALDHLCRLGDESLGAVTAFHIAEHLPFPTLLNLITETRRVLRPGGVVIFETPNPENLIVGACNFYFDPTHRSPIPPPLLEFFVQQAGFGDVTIMRLHPSDVPDAFSIDDPFLKNWLFGPQDYAVIGRKPAGSV